MQIGNYSTVLMPHATPSLFLAPLLHMCVYVCVCSLFLSFHYSFVWSLYISAFPPDLFLLFQTPQSHTFPVFLSQPPSVLFSFSFKIPLHSEASSLCLHLHSALVCSVPTFYFLLCLCHPSLNVSTSQALHKVPVNPFLQHC